jgi:hypothetical protein
MVGNAGAGGVDLEPLAEAPGYEEPEEFEIAEEVSLPQASGFLIETEGPFEAAVLHPFGSAVEESGEDLKAASDADGERDLEGADVVVDEELLLRASEANEEKVRIGLGDLIEDRLQGLGVELKAPRRAACAGDLKTGVALAEYATGLVGGVGAATEEEDAQLMCCAALA